MEQIKVTYSAQWKVGKETKYSKFVEYTDSEASANLRALALNWTIVSMEKAD